MRPGFALSIQMMNRLRIPQKFLVLAIIYVVAVAAVGVSLYQRVSHEITSSQKEIDGITAIAPVIKFEQFLQLHRGLSGGLLGGEEPMRERIAKLDTAISNTVATIPLSLHSMPALQGDWLSIQTDWDALQTRGLRLSVTDNFSAHTDLIEKVQVLCLHMADASGLSVDPDIAAHYLLNTAIVELPAALEEIAKIRGLGTAILAKKASLMSQTERIQASLTELSVARQSLAENIEETSIRSPEVRMPLELAFAQFNTALSELLALVQLEIMTGRFGVAPGDYFTQASAVIDLGYEQLFVTLLPTASGLIQLRLKTAQVELAWSLGIASATLLIALYLFAGIYFSTTISISTLAKAATRFAAGDLTQRTHLVTHDELAQVGDSFNHMADGFSKLLIAQQEGEERLQAIVNSALDAVIQMDNSGRISGWNMPAQSMFGWSSEEAIGRKLHQTIIPERYRARHLQGLKKFLETGKGAVLNSRVEVEGLHRDGHEFPIELVVSSIKTVRGVEFNAFASDITERRRAETALKIAAVAFDTDDGIVVTDEQGMTLNANQSFSKITGYSTEEIIGHSPFILKMRRYDEKDFEPMWKALAQEKAWQGEIWSRRKNGEEYPEWMRVTAVTNSTGLITNYVVSFSDITQRKKFEDTIHKLAFYDPLTDLPNRRLLMDRLQQRLAASARSGLFGAVLMIDLDHFKSLNDTKGHEVGDTLLIHVARRLTGSVREGDTVSRLGGDEFVVLLGGLHLDVHEAAALTEIIGRKILLALNEPYLLGTIEHSCTASIGATMYRGNELPAEVLFKQADLAMYKSKEMGRNTLHFFDPLMQTVILERAALETGLRDAIFGNQMLLHYQPQVTDGNRMTGAEALIRWQHPLRGVVLPADFIHLAEETGLILPLGNWVINSACDQLAKWQRSQPFADFTLAVNVSAKQFHESNFVEQVSQALARSGASPQHLKLELTESILVANMDDIVEKMFALKALGVTFSLDDFGTGYSSLSYLKRLPLDQLKIDQSFVRNILVDPNDAAIVRAIVALAQSLGFGVIAEGVETQAQRDFLASIGCHAFQGYFFSRPLGIRDFEVYATSVAWA